MFKLATEAELLKAFRPRDRKHVQAPPDRSFPIVCLDYLTWPSEHGERVFLAFKTRAQRHVTGIAFWREKGTIANAAPRTCNWCNAWGSANSIGILTADVNSRRSVGVFVCLDLLCGARVEEDANRRGKSALDAKAALLEKMNRFASEALGITQDNRNAAAP